MTSDVLNAVDMGLSVKWASCNIGASCPEDYGDYYSWGETITKDDYSFSTYRWCNGTDNMMTKYCTKKDDGIVDKKKTLAIADDIAAQLSGGKWHIPTAAEWEELCKKCDWKWTIRNGVRGYRITSKRTGNSIFLPAAGRRNDNLYDADSIGFYWSSSLDSDFPRFAWSVNLYSDGVIIDDNNRCGGLSVRPVTK